MKKKTFGIVGIIIVVLLLIIGFSINTDKDSSSEDVEMIIANAQKESANVKEEEKRDFINITVDDYLNKYNGEAKELILIGRPTCHYCQIAEPILHNISYIYNVDINYINTDEFADADGQKLIESDSFFASGFGTPLLLVVSNGKINDKVDGLTDTAHYVKFLKNNNFIN